jgi:DNA-binding beta-propeller fold protein YncE
MSTIQTLKSTGEAIAEKGVGRLIVLNLSGGQIVTLNADGTEKSVILSDCRWPDGVAVDANAGHIYWTNMGVPNLNDGSIERVNLDGSNRVTIVPKGATFTPKQIQLDKTGGKLYWADREGMRVMRSNLDGSKVETLIDSSQGDVRPGQDATKWCVGIAVDTSRNQVYWTQKGGDNAGKGRIFRANIEIPNGKTAATRSDIETLFGGLPEPIDLELDQKHRVLYWTDRGDPPRGNTVNRASIGSYKREEPEILITHLMEGIGIALDVPGDRLFATDLAGSVYVARLDGSQKRPLLVAQGNLSGVAYIEQ